MGAERLALPGPGQAEIPAGTPRGFLALHLLPGGPQPPGKGQERRGEGRGQGGTFGAVPSPGWARGGAAGAAARTRQRFPQRCACTRGKHWARLRFLLFLPGVTVRRCPPQTLFCHPTGAALLSLSGSCFKTPSSFAAHLFSPLLAALLLVRGCLPADGQQGFPALGEGHLEHLPGQERGKDRAQGTASPPGMRWKSHRYLSCPSHRDGFFNGVFTTDVALLLLVPLRVTAMGCVRHGRERCTTAAAPVLGAGGRGGSRQRGRGAGCSHSCSWTSCPFGGSRLRCSEAGFGCWVCEAPSSRLSGCRITAGARGALPTRA